MEKEYVVVQDLYKQGFAIGMQKTAEGWRKQTIQWADADGDIEAVDELKELESEEIIPYIEELLGLIFEEVKQS